MLISFSFSTASAQVINEIRIDQSGDDTDEYIEIAGAPGTDLTGLAIVVIGDDDNDSSGVIEEVVDLTGAVIGASGYYVIAEPTFSLGTADRLQPLNFEEDDNVTFLLVEGFSGALGDDLDTNDDGVLDITPWTRIVDLIALLEEENPPQRTEFHYGPPAVGPDEGFTPAHVYRCPDGDPSGTFQIGSFYIDDEEDTPGSRNTGCVQDPPDDMPDAGPRGPDAGSDMMPDAGPDTPGPDAAPGTSPDAGGTGGQPDGSDGGCCSVSGQAHPGNLLLVLFVGGMLLVRRRRSC